MSLIQDGDVPPQPEPTTDDVARLDERRRIARELHDTTSQLVVALQLQLGQLRRTGVSNEGALFDEIEQVLRDIHESIRHVDLRLNDEDKGLDGMRARVAGVFYSLGAHPRPVR